VAAIVNGSWALVPLDGGTRARSPSHRTTAGHVHADGRALFVRTFGEWPPSMVWRVYRYDLAREEDAVARARAADVAGPAAGRPGGRHDADGRWYAHNYMTQDDQLYVVEGLR